MAASYDEFEGKIAVVMGGALGIGKACAVAFAGQKAKVVVADVNEEAGGALRDAVVRDGGSLRFARVDATNPEEVARLAEEVEREGELAAVVNCVGGWTRYTPALELSVDQWDRGIKFNLYATFYSCQAFGNVMKKQGHGAIVNISSTSSRTASPNSPIYYGVSKSGVDAITRILARELGPYGVRLNAVGPGATMSERIKQIYTPAVIEELRSRTARGKLAEPEEIASVVLFLASDQAVHVTGIHMLVTGGQLIVA